MFEGVDSRGHVFEGYREANASKVSLQDRLQNIPGQPFSLEETFTILAQLGQALSYAHQCNVTHGNLKPHNILFNEKGDVLLAEFFLHALATQPDNATTPEDSAYRAPELLPGHASKEGDQYALGYIAYEMLTGHKPFLIASVSKPDTFYYTKKPIPPKHFNPALSSLYEEAILKAIAKEPAQRHRDISGFLSALGIPTATRDLATSMETVPLPLILDPPEQADPLQAATEYAIEEAETSPTLYASTPALTVHPAQTSLLAEAEDNTSMGAFEPYTLADSISSSPDDYSVARNLLADTIATNPEISIQTSAYAVLLSKNSAKPFFKRRWIGMGITCLVVVGIIVMSFFVLPISRSAQEHKTIPVRDTTIDPLSPTPAITTPTLGITPTPEPTPTIAPSPTVEPTVTVEPTPTPTQKRHGHH